jgi:hypothetical protein
MHLKSEKYCIIVSYLKKVITASTISLTHYRIISINHVEEGIATGTSTTCGENNDLLFCGIFLAKKILKQQNKLTHSNLKQKKMCNTL